MTYRLDLRHAPAVVHATGIRDYDGPVTRTRRWGERDPVTFAAVPVLLVLMALIAAFQPARRAIAVQPAEALRAE